MNTRKFFPAPARFLLLATTVLATGMSMPSCPGQQAMQQQVDTLTTQNADLTKKLQAMDGQVKALNADMLQVKQLLKPMSDAIQAQRNAMDQLAASMKDMHAKLSAPKGKAAAPAKKKGK